MPLANSKPSSWYLTLLLIVLSTTLASAQVIVITGPISDGLGGPLVAGPVYHATGNVTVPAGLTLTVQPGAIIKFAVDASVFVGGTLNAVGTAGLPINFTSEQDDALGGDTTLNGASVGSSNYWRGLNFAAGSAGTVNHGVVRFGGRNLAAGIEVTGNAAVTLANTTVAFCQTAGLDLNGTATGVTVTNCAFNSNNRAVDAARLDSLAGFSGNTASGNAGLDSMAVSIGTIATPTLVPASARINGVIVLDTSITVNGGATLTLEPGVVVKFRALDVSVIVNGALNVMGTMAQPVVFTEIGDDSVAGDTNENGPSSTSGNFWRGLQFNGGSGPSMVSWTEIRGGGRNLASAIEIAGGSVSVLNSTVSSCQVSCLDMNNMAAAVSITNCAFNSSNRAVEGVPINMVPNFVNNTATGNVVHNSLSLSSATVSGNLAISSQNLISNVILLPVGASVPMGASLTLAAGVTIKMTTLDLTLTVSGVLNANGTAGNPVVFTTLLDDQFGGDTDLNGPTSVAGNFWRGLNFTAGSGPSTMTHTRVRGGGRSLISNVEVTGANLTMTQCTIDHSQVAAMDLNSSVSTISVTQCAFNNSARAIVDVPLVNVPGFVNNTATGNSVSDSLLMAVTTVVGTVSIGAANMLNGCVLVPTTVSVPAGTTLNLGEGVVFKLVTLDLSFTVDGTLNCTGTSTSPIAITTIDDDSFAGDTGKNGASSVSGNFWRGMAFNAGSAASVLDYVFIRGTGRNLIPAVSVVSAATFFRCTVDFGQVHGFSFNNSSAQPIIRECLVRNCLGTAFTNARFASLRNLEFNVAINNGANYALVTSNVVGVDDHVFERNLPSGVVAVAVNPTIGAGMSLTLHQGVIVKMFNLDLLWNVSGALNLLGTGFEPVVLTTITDDDFGGDSNGGGPSTSAPNFWRGVTYLAAATTSTVENAFIRGGGRNLATSFDCNSPNVRISSLRVDRSQVIGIAISAAAGDLVNLVVQGALSTGIVLSGGTFDLVHATVTGCGGAGVNRSGAGWTGEVRNTISWNNTGGNYTGTFTTANLMFSDGSAALAGMAGNINADPLFVAAGTGDLSLSPGSPCLETADPTLNFLLLLDHAEGCRWLDSTLTGVLLPDMGAFERTNWSLEVQGDARTAGVQTYTLSGIGGFGLGILIVGIGDAADYFTEYGFLTIGHRSTVLPIMVLSTDTPFPVTIPDVPALEGFHYQIQGLVVSPLNTTRGNFTERYRATIAN